jgi:hypothetical protein
MSSTALDLHQPYISSGPSYQGGSWQRVNRRQPCPVCHKSDFCEVSSDGQTAHCMRIASDRPTAYRQGGWLHQIGFNLPTATAGELLSHRAEKIALTEVTIRHEVIVYLLNRLELNREHQAYLLAEGFQPEQALKLGYRTLPRTGRDQLAREIVELVGPEEARGLAFLYEKKGKGGSRYFQFAAARPDVLLIPIRDMEGRYLGLKGRWTTTDEKSGLEERQYRLLSAGTSGGASLGTPLHIARPEICRNPGRVLITEGEKKADYIAYRTGLVCIGVLGTGNWRATGDDGHLVSTLARLGAK